MFPNLGIQLIPIIVMTSFNNKYTDATRDYHTKWSQKDKYHMISLSDIHLVESKIWQMNLSSMKQTESQTEDRLVVEEGGDWGRNGVRGWS